MRRGRTARYYVKAAALRASREVLAEAMPALFAPRTDKVRLSARNQLYGKVVEVRAGDVTSEVSIDIGGQLVAAVITNSSLQRLDLKVGDVAAAVFKALDVIVLK